jgi:hypothetical protein
MVRTETTNQAITFYVDMLQLEQKAYPTSWTLGGTTRAASGLSTPITTVNKSQGTIKAWVYITPAIKSTSGAKYIFDANGTGYLRCYHANGSDVFKFDTNDGSNTSSVTSGALTLNTWNELVCSYDGNSADFYVNGSSVGTPVTNPKLPTLLSTFNWGGLNDGSGQADAPLKFMTVLRRKQTPSEILADYQRGQPLVTKDTTFYLDGRYDLQAYKIAAGG